MSDLNKKASLSDHLNKAKEMASDHNDKMQAQIDKCVKCVPSDDDAAKAAIAELAKTAAAAPAVGTVATAAAPLAAALADFHKTANDSVATAIASMTVQFTTFMDTLSKTLEPPKAVQTDPAGRVVAKTADAGVVTTETTAAAPAVPTFVPLHSGAPVDPKVREAIKAVRGAALGE